jgi:hypothetical protein
MPIRPFLAGQAFQPETIRDMSDALDRVCTALGVRAVDETTNRVVAAKIIQLAQRGVHGVDRLCTMALTELKAPQ